MFNPWKQIRLIGAVVCFIAAVLSNVILSFIGLMVIAIGVIGSVDRLERRLEEKALEENGNEPK